MAERKTDPYFELELMLAGFGLFFRTAWHVIKELDREHFESWTRIPTLPESVSPYRDQYPDWEI